MHVATTHTTTICVGPADGEITLSHEGIRLENTVFCSGNVTSPLGIAAWNIEPLVTFGGITKLGIGTPTQRVMTLTNNGNVGIGTSNPQEKLDVNGNAIFSNKVYINTTPSNITGTQYELNVCGTIQVTEWIVETGWCDFALKPGYKKMNWHDKRKYYQTLGFLPYMDSGAEIEKNGLHSRNLKGMIWNIEENRLDIDELFEKNEALEKKNKELEKRISELEKKLFSK